MNSLILQALAPLASLRRDGKAYFKEMIKTKINNKDAKETTKMQKEQQSSKKETIDKMLRKEDKKGAPTGWYMLHVGGSIPPGPTLCV